ncbi:succinate dehydrogenase/fumarate reductase iron-sulfur subunit [Herpetosiphon giganteus]|uniref:succinate dehydrogenase/fumarate reductase iron-sulfur subunit n=1 Tax=Herpetosiphon giganteus TaxID=2029754 RepID=UPI0019582E57|nr:succinate dehydrogenase iron-sulfur subunit [Herpetosiphon giganteus]MBM7845030.1 succinate dehydrogenase / fumarate reductase iron-sulfur subunit [Herpetosiphon giganteus]
MKVTFRVPRFDAATDFTAKYQIYHVEVTPYTTILDALNIIKEEQDSTLAFRRGSQSGIDGSCGMMVNGRNRLASTTRVMGLNATEIALGPLPGFPVIRDLVVDFDSFFAKDAVMLPYLVTDIAKPEDGKERLQSPKDANRIALAATCNQCGCCTSACPVHWSNGEYYGPSALTRAYRFVEDSRDTAIKARLEIVGSETGVWRCHTIFNCSECPKSIPNGENIQALKRKIMLNKIGLGRIEVKVARTEATV